MAAAGKRRTAGRIVRDWLMARLDPVTAERIRLSRRLGYLVHLRRPRSLNEKLAHAKLLAPPAEAAILADKWRVRDYVRDRVGAAVLNEVHGCYERAAEIRFEALPDAFVLKTNNASGRNLFVEDKAAADLPAIRARLERWLAEPYGERSGERWYGEMPPRILAERFLRDSEGRIPADYKLLAFHGRVHFIQVDTDRFSGHNQRFFDRDWVAQDFAWANPLGRVVPRPANLDELIRVAEALAAGLDFVRVDLYSLDERRVVFGEMSLTPHGGWGRFTPRRADFELGRLW